MCSMRTTSSSHSSTPHRTRGGPRRARAQTGAAHAARQAARRRVDRGAQLRAVPDSGGWCLSPVAPAELGATIAASTRRRRCDTSPPRASLRSPRLVWQGISQDTRHEVEAGRVRRCGASSNEGGEEIVDAYPVRFPAKLGVGSARRREEAMQSIVDDASTQRSSRLVRQAPRENDTGHLVESPPLAHRTAHSAQESTPLPASTPSASKRTPTRPPNDL